MARLPTPGSDNGVWGNVLNEFLSVELNTDGTLKKAGDIAQAVSNASTALSDASTALSTANAKYTKPGTGIPEADLATAVQTKLNATHSEVNPVTFSHTGSLFTGSGASRWYADGTWTITEVRASVATAPTGASIIVDVHKNGTTVFTNQANRPAITASTNTSSNNIPAVTTLADNDYLTIDIDQVGSTEPGAYLTVQILLTRAL